MGASGKGYLASVREAMFFLWTLSWNLPTLADSQSGGEVACGY